MSSIPLLTSEVSKILGIAEATVRAWERSGRLHAVKTLRGTRLFDRHEVERVALERRAKELDADGGEQA